MLSVIYRKGSHAKQAAHPKSSRLRMNEENFRTELSRITFYDYIYILSFNYSYRYEINLIRIMYAANSSILYSKEKTVRILTSILSECLWVIPNKSNFKKN